MNRLVFIGRNLDADEITRGFEGCLFVPGSRDAATVADPFGRYIEISPYTLDQIRYWMRQNFNFAKDVPIVIKEVPCIKEKCPPIETAILAIEPNAPPRAFKVQKPINEIHVRSHLRSDREPDALLLTFAQCAVSKWLGCTRR